MTILITSNLPPALGAAMNRAAAKQWLVAFADGDERFFVQTEAQARRLVQMHANAGRAPLLFRPGKAPAL